LVVGSCDDRENSGAVRPGGANSTERSAETVADRSTPATSSRALASFEKEQSMSGDQTANDGSTAGHGPDTPAFSNLAGLGLLAVGIVLLLLPIIIAAAAPAVLVSAQFYLRIAAALGGALIGGFIPGVLQITLPWIKGAGAMGLFVLIYAVNPPAIGAATANPASSVATTVIPPASTGDQLKKWIVPGRGAPTKIDTAHLQALQAWTSRSETFKNIPVAVFVSSDNPAIEQARKAAIKDLKIPKPAK
jgi:hypothetical protein